MTNKIGEDPGDWDAATFEGSRRAQLMRWRALPLADKLRAVEEMRELADRLAEARRSGRLREPDKNHGASPHSGEEQ